MKFVIVCLSLLFSMSVAEASIEQERAYLVQLVNQLAAMTPLILAAQKEQPANTRVTFHYTAYRDATGQKHNGLLEDVQAIKQGIEEKLNAVSAEPRVVMPVQGDYLDEGKAR